MKKIFCFVLLAISCICGYAQVIAPALLQEMSQRRDDEKIRVFVIMRQQYDQKLLNDRAKHFATRSERRDFVVNELKQFAEVTQSDLRHMLYEMERNAMVSEPKVLWVANAICFDATQRAIYDLASRTDIKVIGFDVERKMTPEDEDPQPASNMREITPNVLQVGANQVWDLGYTGQNVVVAVVDGGVNYNHLDLADHLWDGGSEFPHHGYDVGEEDDDPMDTAGHGTHCAGTVCGDGTAGSQTGMAPDATLMCIKIYPDEGDVPISLLCFAFQWVVEHGGDVISCSQGWYDSWIDSSYKELCRNTCVSVLSAGVVASIAAGNEGRYLDFYPIPYNIRYPGACPPPYLDPDQQPNSGDLSCAVSVGAVDYDDIPTEFTSYGPSTWTNTSFGDYPYTKGSPTEFGLIRPDVCAPGFNVKSAKYDDIAGYTNMSGTSMAAPCVAGCMALMLSKNPNLTPADVCRILEETSLQLTESKSNIYGCGRVDVLSAVKAVQAGPLSLSSYVVNDSLGNNDHQLNAGETIEMGLKLTASSPLSGAIMTLTTNSEDVTITNGTLTLPDFTANQTQIVDGFTFIVNDNVPIKRRITFFATISVGGEEVGSFGFTLAVKGATLAYEKAIVVNDSNGNSILEAGENANLRVFIVNNGNDTARTVTGVLSTNNQYLTINASEMDFGSVAIYGEACADFSVSLSSGAPATIPLTLTLTDEDNQQTSYNFNLYTVTLSVSPNGSGTASGSGSYGSGSLATLSAAPNENYVFKRWRKGESTVSYLSPCDVFVTESADYIANFEQIPSNCFVLGTPENTGNKLPSQSFYNYSLTQQIYTAEELGLTEATDLSSIAFFNTGTEKTRTYRIYMVNTDKTAFASGTDWIVPSQADMVFDGSVKMIVGSWTTLYFDKAFAYDGSSNIAIIIDDNTGTYSRGMSCRVFSTSDFQTLHTYADNTNFNPYNPPTTGMLRYKEKNQIILGIASYDYTVTVSADPVDGGTVSVDEGPFYQGQPCTATATSTGDNVFYYWSENGERVSADATYHFRVMASRQLVAHFGPPVTVTVTADPEEGGTVSGGGAYGIGQPVTLSATTNPGYVFSHWSKDGEAVSYLSTWNLLVPGEAGYVAHYDPLPQGAVAVGEAVSTNAVLPSYSYYNYTLSQQIYTAAEIGEAGLIGSIAFFNTGYQKTRNLTIYMVNTEKSVYSGDKDWIVPTEEQQVFSGEVVMAKGRWTTVVLDTAFEYDGVSNLAIIVDDNSGYWTNERVSCRVFETGAVQAIRVYSDGTNYDPMSPSGYSGTTMTVKNQIVVTKVTPTTEPLSVSVCATPALGGTVSGGGMYGFGERCVVSAMPNEGYAFAGWYENGTVVSTDMSYGFGVFGERGLVAHFYSRVQIGDGGTDMSVYLPSFNYYKYCLTEQIYTAEEIGRAGVIATIAFYNGGAKKTRIYDVYMVATDKAAFSGNMDWVAVTGADKVFSGEVTMYAEGWTTIDLNRPFEYDGISNLILVVDDNTGSWTASPHMSCSVFDAPGQAIYVWSDGTNYNPSSPSIYSGNLAAVKNQIILGFSFFHFTTAGNWSCAFNWQHRILPTSEDEAFIEVPCQLDQNVEVSALTITEGQTLTLQSGKTLTVTGDLTNTSPESLVIEDGAQLMHGSENVYATVKKSILGYDTLVRGRYYLISHPLTMDINPEDASNHLTIGDYDLYDWLPGAPDSLEWRNYKKNAFMLSPEGFGYLYANQDGVELNFQGVLHRSDNRFGKFVSCDSGDSEHPGWNLISNPFACDAYLVDENNEPLPYYRMNASGDGFEKVTSGPIAPMEGVFYQALADETVYFTRTAPTNKRSE